MARPTIADIANRAGVSKGAVSFALNGRPGVSDATRERILQIAEQMSWRPHSAARALGASPGRLGRHGDRPAGPHARGRAVLRAPALRRAVGPVRASRSRCSC